MLELNHSFFSWFGSVTLSVCSNNFIKLTENFMKIHIITVSLYVVQYVHICIHCGAREVNELNWPVHSRFWTVRRLTTLMIFFNFRKKRQYLKSTKMISHLKNLPKINFSEETGYETSRCWYDPLF